MIDDQLLAWMSYKTSGKRKDLPSEFLDGRRVGIVVWKFAALGHILPGDDASWQIIPPVLIGGDPDLSPYAILCGARTRALLRALSASAESEGAVIESITVPGQPTVIMVRASTAQAIHLTAKHIGIPLVSDGSFAMMAAAPAVCAWPRETIPPLRGRIENVTRFSRSKVLWVKASPDELQNAKRGVFHLKRDYDAITIAKGPNGEFSQIDVAAGRLLAVANEKLAVYDGTTFTLPDRIWPPAPILRALTSSSGLFPVSNRSTRTISFSQISSRTARLAISTMGIRFQ